MHRRSPRLHLCEAEIQDFSLPAPREKKIRRLDVAMDDAPEVRGGERIGNLDAEI